MISVDNIKLNVGFKENDILTACAQKLKIKTSDILKFEIIKKSIDARRKPNIYFSLNVGVCLKDNLERKFKNLKIELNNAILSFTKKHMDKSPIVVGFGPAGMFCALMLARMGLKPVVFEQGECVEEREESVKKFWQNKELNKYSNVQFGEGGAGTFSDGKLNTNLSSKECKQVLNEFVYFGAPKEILYTSKPHIGSDNLKNIVKNIRNEIVSLGGVVNFSSCLKKINIENNSVKSVVVENVKTGESLIYESDLVVLAVGHSAREMFHHLKDLNIEMKQKPFAMGVRIEQKQEKINDIQYGVGYDKRLPSADYKLVAHLPSGRSVFTFCMCPGGYVVASSSAPGEVVTNGMSNFARDNKYANSALLVNVMPEDFGDDDVLAGVRMQEKYERIAFELAGSNFNAPAEFVDGFLNDKNSNYNKECSYLPGITLCKLKECLPKFVYESLQQGIIELNKKVNNFASLDDLLIGVETRSSSPLTIIRNDNYETNINGIYPIGEGAGYAGGIVSSALDGIKVAKSIYDKLD